MDKVIIKKVADYEQQAVNCAVEEIFSEISVVGSLTVDTKVLLKPNLLAKHRPEAAVTTHPAVVEAVAVALHKRGVKNITLIDSSGGFYSKEAMMPTYKMSGLLEVCQRYNIACGDNYNTVQEAAGGMVCYRFTILEPVATADFIINLPKLKTHAMTGLSCAVKNLFGCVPGLSKAEFHARFPKKELFGGMLIDLSRLVAPQMTIVDAIVAHEGDGPSGGVPRPTGLILAAKSIYNLDLVSAKLIGIDTNLVPTITASIEQGLCPPEFTEDLLQNPEDFNPILDFKLPSSYKGVDASNLFPKFFRGLAPYIGTLAAPRPIINQKICIGCAKCAEICPKDTITMNNKKATIIDKECIRCFCCHEMCPVKAIDIKRLRLFRWLK